MGEKTYSASLRVASRSTAILAVRVFAGAGQVALQLDRALVLGIGGGRVLEDGQPGDAALGSDAEVDGGVVADVATWASPLASRGGWGSDRVQEVLRGSRPALPLIVRTSVWDSELFGLARLELDGDGLGFSARVIRAADGNDRPGVV